MDPSTIIQLVTGVVTMLTGYLTYRASVEGKTNETEKGGVSDEERIGPIHSNSAMTDSDDLKPIPDSPIDIEEESLTRVSPPPSRAEEVLAIVRDFVRKQSNGRDQQILAQFLQNPAEHQEELAEVIERALRARPELVQELYFLTRGANVAIGDSPHGQVSISDNAKSDIAIGVNTGNITYSAGRDVK